MILKIIHPRFVGKDKEDENENCFSLIFEKPKGFNFYPGQYLDIKLSVDDPNGDTKSGDTRAFTISSSPTEDFLMIISKKGISPFKRSLEQLKVGDKIESSHPAGTFTLDESTPAIFLAGGIGITPFRSMLKYVLDQKISTPITLIYSNSTDDFLFKKELENWKLNLSNLTIIYHNSSQNGRLNKTKLTTIVGKTVNPIYYLAGAHSFVNDIAQILIDSEIDETSIRYDRFDGYN